MSAPGRGLAPWQILLLCVILAASLARFSNLEHKVVWHDEVFSIARILGHDHMGLWQAVFSGQQLAPEDLLYFQKPSPDKGWPYTLRAIAEHPEHSPLYYVCARFATQFDDHPLAAMRGTAALFSLLLAPAVFWLMQELNGSGRTPWVAAALVSTSPLLLVYAQEARQYSLWAVLIAASAAALLHATRTGEARLWRLYAVLLVLGLYTHLLFLLMLPVHGLWLALKAYRESNPLLQALRPLIWCWGIALLLFSPWLALLVLYSGEVSNYVLWMQRELGMLDLFTAWAEHLTRIFFDPSQLMPRWALWGLLPLFWVLGRFCRRAPEASRWLLCLLAAVSIAVVLGPDLVSGGVRSQHARYALPALLAILLMVAWVVGDAWDGAPLQRRIAVATLTLLLLTGAWSDYRYLRVDSWWNKNFSSENVAVAKLVNAAERPLVLASPSGVSAGEMISLAYHLRPDVALWGELESAPISLPKGYSSLFVLTPSQRVRDLLDQHYELVPLLGSWQWFRAVPKSFEKQQSPPVEPTT